MSGSVGIVLAIIALGLLVIVHEAGHFLVARWSGMRVLRFSIGFGPAIAKVDRSGTEFRVGLIPFGGYVQIEGMNPLEDGEATSRTSFRDQPISRRCATILAGPAANYLLGFVCLFVFFAFFFVEMRPPVRIVSVRDGSPAQRAGLAKDDLIIGTTSTAFANVDDLRAAIGSAGGGPIALIVRRPGAPEVARVDVTPEPTADGGHLIGIGYEGSERVPRSLGVVESASRAGAHLYAASRDLVLALARLVQPGGTKEVEVAGPIGLVRGVSGQIARHWSDALHGIGTISVLLGFFNLLPIPGLDGSRLMFLALAAIRRKPFHPKAEAIIHFVGVVLLLGMLLFVSVLDVLR